MCFYFATWGPKRGASIGECPVFQKKLVMGQSIYPCPPKKEKQSAKHTIELNDYVLIIQTFLGFFLGGEKRIEVRMSLLVQSISFVM
jgi:hypothetical protein